MMCACRNRPLSALASWYKSRQTHFRTDTLFREEAEAEPLALIEMSCFAPASPLSPVHLQR